jgi:hypothetical protein
VIDIKVRRKHAHLTVTAKSLNEQPTGWLGSWASQLEERHCLAPGEGAKVAERIAESVSLDPAAAFRLLYRDDRQTGEVDIDSQIRLQVVSPFWREAGVGMIDGPFLSVTGTDSHLIVTANSTDNLVGYETTLYGVQPKATRPGYTIKPLYADRHVQGVTERRPEPAINYFHFPADAAFFRLFYESSRTDFTALVIAARTPAELDQRTRKLEASGASASCQTLSNDMCIAIPKDVAVNPLISVTVNGAEILVPRGATVGHAIAFSRQPSPAVGQLTVYRPWNGRLMPVAFDLDDTAILRLVLRGSETISWH